MCAGPSFGGWTETCGVDNTYQEPAALGAAAVSQFDFLEPDGVGVLGGLEARVERELPSTEVVVPHGIAVIDPKTQPALRVRLTLP